MSNTPRPVKCADCGWAGSDDNNNMRSLRDCADLDQRLDPGCTVPAGECVECGAFVYYTDQIERTRWRELANAAIDIIEQLEEGAHDFLWSEVREIIETREEWEKSEETS